VRGLLITFEGVEGCGKSTQAELLYKTLQEYDIECVLTREPGGTPIGEKIREILLDPQFTEMHPRTELLLYLASRNQHVRQRLLPILRTGTIVICDRYAESSLAYQGKARDLSFNVVSRLNRFATGGLRADLVIMVDVPPEVGRARKEVRGTKDEVRTFDVRRSTLDAPPIPDRLESESGSFHEAVREAYLQLAHRAPGRIRIFDGQKPPAELHEAIKETVFDLMKRKGIL
jgi:dTMP kinase